MTKAELRQLSEGDPEPDIEKEGRAVMFFFLLSLCAILTLFLVMGLCYGLYELVKWAVL